MSDEIDERPVALSVEQKMEEYTKVTTTVKVLSKHKPLKLDDGLTKQDGVVINATDMMAETLWEERVDSLEPLQCYKLCQFVVCFPEGSATTLNETSLSSRAFKVDNSGIGYNFIQLAFGCMAFYHETRHCCMLYTTTDHHLN